MFTLREDDPLCEWDGELLPLEDVDFLERIEHGSARGYNQHRHYGIPQCDECLAARREWKRARRLAAKSFSG